MTPRKTENITEKKICQHIEDNINTWLFVGHIESRHINATENELLARIGKYDDDGKFITRASSFVDESGGDDVVDGLVAAIKSRVGKIREWLCCGSDPVLKLYFSEFPDGVSGITCTIGQDKTSATNGYIVILCKNEQYPFYLLNTYPVLINI